MAIIKTIMIRIMIIITITITIYNLLSTGRSESMHQDKRKR